MSFTRTDLRTFYVRGYLHAQRDAKEGGEILTLKELWERFDGVYKSWREKEKQAKPGYDPEEEFEKMLNRETYQPPLFSEVFDAVKKGR